MADLALATANKIDVVVPIVQFDAPAGEALLAGQCVRFDVATGMFTSANGTNAAEARIFGICLKTVPVGMAVTVLRKGILDGFLLAALAYDAAVFLSDTDGKIGTTAGTVSVTIGRVVSGFATTLGTAADKLLFIDL